MLVGWDFSFGYPKGLAKALRIPKRKRAWQRIWHHLDRMIIDCPDNYNNRFTVGAELNRKITVGSGPFWGVPAGQSGIFLGSRKDFSYPVINRRASLPEKRLVEQRVPKMQPAWKLAYTGSVGSQTLLGIPRVLYLSQKVNALAPITRIWPFETDFAERVPEAGPLVVHTEIYPSLLKLPGKDKIVDREQVRTFVKYLQAEQAEKGAKGLLAAPVGLSLKDRKRVLRHEGWVLGVE